MTASIPVSQPPLRVIGLIATKRSDADRGPMLRLNGAEATRRTLLDGELAWVHGPRRAELCLIRVDDTVPRGDVVLRDSIAAAPSELIRIEKVNLDARHAGHLA